MESISRIAGLSLWRKDGSTETIYGGDEKYQLMGWEAKDFYRYITGASSQEEYAACSRLAVDVAEFLEEAREKAGIHFESDN